MTILSTPTIIAIITTLGMIGSADDYAQGSFGGVFISHFRAPHAAPHRVDRTGRYARVLRWNNTVIRRRTNRLIDYQEYQASKNPPLRESIGTITGGTSAVKIESGPYVN